MVTVTGDPERSKDTSRSGVTRNNLNFCHYCWNGSICRLYFEKIWDAVSRDREQQTLQTHYIIRRCQSAARETPKQQAAFVQDGLECFWHFFKNPSCGEVYNTGGGRYSNCSIIEALDIIEKIKGFKIKKKILKQNRIGDHIWYVSSMKKFKKKYPRWKQKYSTHKIIKELIHQFS